MIFSQLKQLYSLEEREKHLYELMPRLGIDSQFLSYRDFENASDVFLLEFPEHEILSGALWELGASRVGESNFACLIVPHAQDMRH